MTSKKYYLSSKGKLAFLLETFVSRWHDRPDSEHEQAALRLLVGWTAIIYLFMAYMVSDQRFSAVTSTLYCISLFSLMSCGVIVWLIIRPGMSVTRRLAGAVTDIYGISVLMYLHGNLAAPLFVVYLWVIFGNGFRFGRLYLFFSMALSIGGYCLVVLFSQHWTTTPYMTFGLLIGLIVLPFYVASLLGRLTTALDDSEAANEAKSTFLAVMSHEIRTPLSGIIGLISLFKQTSLDKQQRHYVKLVENSSNWLSRVISDGLDYSKIEADELVIDSSPFNLQQVLEEICAVYREMALARDLDFFCKIADDVPRHLIGDQFKLVQICNNILSNAFKFTQNGEIALTVSTANRINDTVNLVFKISDTGIGISEGEIGSIFEPFRQLDSSASRKYGGTGLGLAICSKIIGLLGSTLEVESVVDKGTVFQFALTFPVADGMEKPLTARVDSTPVLQWIKSPKILLVEDNDVNREVISHLLHSIGGTVTVAENGSRAVELAGLYCFDLIFMDCQMPIMDGYEATERIRTEHGLGEVPIIALTAHVTVADRERCFAAGMEAYLGKPCSLSDLRTILIQWLPDLLKGSECGSVVKEDICKRSSLTVTPERSVEMDIQPNREKLHDLRNIYSKIMGNTELALLSLNSPEKLEKYLERILSETKKAAETSAKID